MALPPVEADGGWTPLRPDVLRSAAGATLTRLADDSVLASGPNSETDAYTLEAEPPLSRVTAFRLEALTDPSLPGGGPGRASHGEFCLDVIRFRTVPAHGPPMMVNISRAWADYSDRRFHIEGIDGAIKTAPTFVGTVQAGVGWMIWPQTARSHRAVFQTARPIATGDGTRLRVELSTPRRFASLTLGRFRVSITDRPVPLLETSLMSLRADGARSGRTRLAAAYVLLGDWASAAAVLAGAVARPEASALDRFLLALARHHLGRIDEARSDCDRSLARPGSDLADEPTRDVAVEALMTIRGLSVDEADSVLLDLVFPAEPFAR
jgi:hypothetical protein